METSTIRALLLDLDNVLLQKPQECIIEHLRELLGVDTSDFFQTTYQDCLRGECDLADALTDQIVRWGWRGTVEEFLYQWFSREAHINVEVLLSLLRCTVPCFFVSDNTELRKRDLLENHGLRSISEGSFFSASVGYCKGEAEYWEAVLRAFQKKGVSSQQIIFFDVDEEALHAAVEFRVYAHMFRGVASLQEALEYYGVYDRNQLPKRASA